MTFLPIVVRELRVAARRKATYWFRFWAAATIITIGFLVILSASSSRSSNEIGRFMYGWESSLVLGVCLFAGVFLTADCLSFERREGTLGLLFLADLKGHDIVLGKLASCSIQSFAAVLATLPMLGLPLLMGGTTGGEFARLIGVLVSTMIWSLSIGMAVSACLRDSRQTIVLTLGLVILLAGVSPVMALYADWLMHWPRLSDWLRAISPVGALVMAHDDYFRTSKGGFFWISIGILWGLSIVALVFSSVLLPATVSERTVATTTRARASFWQQLRFSRDPAVRRRWLKFNPFYWLVGRDRLGVLLTWPAVLLIGGVWFCFFIAASPYPNRSRQGDFMGVALLAAYALHFVFKALVALEATRRLHEDRQSGALELLLVTPLPVKEILRGQWLAFRRRFFWPLVAVLTVNAGLFWLIAVVNPMGMDDEDQFYFCFLMVGGAVLLPLDFRALVWVGMKEALQRKRHHWAMLGAFGAVMLPTLAGVLFFLLMVVAGPNLSSKSEPEILIVFWMLASGLYAGLLTLRTRLALAENFRKLSAGLGTRPIGILSIELPRDESEVGAGEVPV